MPRPTDGPISPDRQEVPPEKPLRDDAATFQLGFLEGERTSIAGRPGRWRAGVDNVGLAHPWERSRNMPDAAVNVHQITIPVIASAASPQEMAI